jgi:MSHA biogenesis protein MshO
MTRAPSSRPASGFTLIELIVVIVLLGVISAGVATFIQPSVAAYTNVKVRAELMDQADTAVRRMVQDIQKAVPNSIRSATTGCFELIPAAVGGRYRMAADTVNDSSGGCTPSNTCSAPLDTTKTTTVFDSLSTLSTIPDVGDWVVVNNQNGNDVYEGSNRSAITAIATYSSSAPTTAPTLTQGAHRITINAIQFSAGYDGGRYLVVPKSQQAVFYVCAGTGSNSSGDGTGTLYRLKAYGFNATYPSSCPSTTGADILATKVKSCSFIYDPSQGATQQSGYVSLDIEVMRNYESVHLTAGAHISNVP